ncbi:MAG TPA: rod shape-determining protein MreC [Bacteroidota bacterium]|nr:rod shape-determining protein MreC [Bacteroidota bacterium]
MQKLFNILVLFKEYVIFVVLLIVSLILLGTNDNTQIRAIRSYTIGFVGIFEQALSAIPNFVELKRENEILRQLNVNLSDEVNRLREARLENIRLRNLVGLKEQRPCTLITGDVVGKSLHLLRNTITLNIGESDGVKSDMPIISENGLVGRILITSSHYAIGQLMLNKDFRASAKIQRSRIDGIIAWDGGENLHLNNVAKSQDIRPGDVVMTSEYSNIFPRNVKIGFVSKVNEKPGNLFKEIEVTPSVDFSTLEQVFVIAAVNDAEREALEKKTYHAK